MAYILSPNQRYEVANYKNVFISTNLEVEDAVRNDFGGCYTRLFVEVLNTHDHRAVITEYAWQTSSCDPSPVPPLTKNDLYVLGGDVLLSNKKAIQAMSNSIVSTPSTPVFLTSSQVSTWVLTRLHTQYSRKTLNEDLVLTPAKPVVGGRGANGVNSE